MPGDAAEPAPPAGDEPPEQTPPPPPRIPSDLVAADTSGLLYRIDRFTGNASPIPISAPLPPDSDLVAIRWGSDGGLYGALLGVTPAIVRFDLSGGSVRVVASGPPLSMPYGVAALEDGRLLVADGGRVGEGDVSAEAQRVIEVEPASGAMRVVATDARFAAPGADETWMDIAVAADGTVYLATAGADHRVLTPADTSDDGGSGALWRIDPATGTATVVAAHADFHSPEGVTVLADGRIALTDWTSKTVFRVDPSSGGVEALAVISDAGKLWGVEELQDGKLAVVGVCGDPLDLDPDDCGPGGIWIVDPETGAVELLVSDPRFSTLSHVRVLLG